MSRSPVSHRVAATVAACSIATISAGSLAGCGSSSKSGTNPAAQVTGGASTKPATKAGAGSGSSGGLAGAINVCALLPATTLSQITGKQFTMTERDDTPSYKIYSCNYTSTVPQGANQMDLNVVGKNGAAGFAADLDAANQSKSSLTQLKQVSGIGDKALGGGIQGRLEVLYGDVLIRISGLTEVTVDQGKQIISRLHAKL